MEWNTASALAAQRRADLARDATLVRTGRALRNRKGRERAVRNPKAGERLVGLR